MVLEYLAEAQRDALNKLQLITIEDDLTPGNIGKELITCPEELRYLVEKIVTINDQSSEFRSQVSTVQEFCRTKISSMLTAYKLDATKYLAMAERCAARANEISRITAHSDFH